MKLYVTRDNINHRGTTVNSGDVIEELDGNHIGSLQSVGCQKYDELKHGPEKKAAKVESVEPKPAKKKVGRKSKS